MSFIHTFCRLTAALALGAGLAAPASAATWRVQPGESIQAIIDRAAPGDVIEIERARYLGHLMVDKPLTLRRCLQNSRMLSSDVSAGFDPNFAGVFEKRNASIVGNGVTFNKFTGSRGKSGSNDANAEFVAQVRRICDEANVCWQTAELGKVDVGGGGTIAYICAKYGMNVIDCGIPVLSMHAPWEVISKVDLWEEYKCYCAFLKGAREF